MNRFDKSAANGRQLRSSGVKPIGGVEAHMGCPHRTHSAPCSDSWPCYGSCYNLGTGGGWGCYYQAPCEQGQECKCNPIPSGGDFCRCVELWWK